MKGSFSRRTINASMPVIQAIFSNLEIETKKYKDLDKRDTFHLFALEKEFGIASINRAMMIIADWISDTPYKADMLVFTKKKSAKWNGLIDIIDNGIIAFNNNVASIEIKVGKDKILYREINGETFALDKPLTELQFTLIKALHERRASTPTKELVTTTGFKNRESLLKVQATLNKRIMNFLQLPRDLIEVERKEGSRINPLYHLVFAKK